MRSLLVSLVVSMSMGTTAIGHEEGTPFAEWMMSLERPDFPSGAFCCGPADQVFVDKYETSETDPTGFRALYNGDWVEIPGRKVIWDRVNPTGRGVLFISRGTDNAGYVYCFVPGSGT